MSGWFRKAVLSNLVLKLLSLALAVLLFVVVHSEKQSLAQGSVAVSYTVPSGKVLVSKPPTSLRIGVAGPASRMQRFHLEELGPVHVDLSNAAEGYFKFTEDMVPLPVGLKIAFVRPDGFPLRFEPTFRRAVAVRVEVLGDPAPGYRITARTVTPARVTVGGPRRVVQAIAALRTEPLTVEGSSSTVRERLAVLLPPGVQEAEPAAVEASVGVAAVVKEASLRGVRVVLDDAAGRSGQVAPGSVAVRLEGPADVLATVKASALSARVRTTAAQSGRLEVRPSIEGLPEGVKVIKLQPTSLEVRLAAAARRRPAP